MKSTAVENVVYTGNNGKFSVHTRLRVQQYISISSSRRGQVVQTCQVRVHKRWRVQQSTTLCTLLKTEYLKYIRGCVYNSILYYLPADLYKLEKHVRWRVHRRWRVQQSATLYKLVTTEYLIHTRLREHQYILLSSSRRVQAVQTC